MSDNIKKIFGIDLGTAYSSIAYVDEFGKAVVVPNLENQRLTPSVVFFDGDNIVVGDVAKESSKLYPSEVISFIKRSIGEENFVFDYDSKIYRPEEISSFILRKLAQDAQQNLGENVNDVVITCPAYFGINEREATKIAGEIAGLNVRQILNEPTAAAIAYGTFDSSDKQVVLVYDLGGGTFDITMIDVQQDSIEVICTGGDHNLGGKDWDDRIVAHLVERFQKKVETDEDILEDLDTWQDLQLAAERSKKILTQREKTPISITHGGHRIKIELKRDKFEEITHDLLERTIFLTKEMLKEAQKKGYKNFDQIILVGGSTRMPQIIKQIKQEFSITPKIFDPDEAVAKGAAIFGWKLSINDDLIKRIAEKTKKSIDEVASDIDLDSEPAMEAVQQIANDTGYTLPAVKSSLVKIKNVTSKSFGVVANNAESEELVYNIIKRNIPVPADAAKVFYTAFEGQKTVLIRIMENETSEQDVPTDQAIEIGTAVLNLPDGLPVDLPIVISFNLNEEGRLKINANAVQNDKKHCVNVSVDTNSVIHGKELEQAKARSKELIVS
ncbi:Hsp70 family protein [Candidatus Magnetomoraceae bacterium gMMP-1]